MGEVVEMKPVDPKQIVDRMGRHTLVLQFRPDEPPMLRWSWILRITTTTEYTGYGETPGLCRAQAARLSAFHDRMDAQLTAANKRK